MKLFKVVNVFNPKLTKEVKGKTYKTKAGAKRLRDELNGAKFTPVLNKKGKCVDTHNPVKDKGWRVALGPDHWKNKSA